MKVASAQILVLLEALVSVAHFFQDIDLKSSQKDEFEKVTEWKTKGNAPSSLRDFVLF